MESDISLSLCSDQTLVKSKQCLVDFIHIVVSPFDKIFYNDVEFARMGKGKACLTLKCYTNVVTVVANKI